MGSYVKMPDSFILIMTIKSTCQIPNLLFLLFLILVRQRVSGSAAVNFPDTNRLRGKMLADRARA
jgi:hypothetical protein